MTSRDCENCGREIGPLERTCSYLGRVVCTTCKAKFDKQLQALTDTNDDTETETPNANEQIETGGDTQGHIPETEESATAELSQPITDETPIAEVSIAKNTDMKSPRKSTMKAKIIVSLFVIACLAGLVIAHVQLRQETTRLRQAILRADEVSRDNLDVSNDIKQMIKKLDSEIDDVRSRLDDLESHYDDLERKTKYLETMETILEAKIKDIPKSPYTRFINPEAESLK